MDARVDCFPAYAAFPKWQEGRHPHCHFRGLHRLHSVTARRIAQPPKVTFVTRLQPSQLPDQAARQLPDLSTIIRVESSSTGVSRLRGALPISNLLEEGEHGRPRCVGSFGMIAEPSEFRALWQAAHVEPMTGIRI